MASTSLTFTPTWASVKGNKLEVTFTKPLDTVSVPVAAEFVVQKKTTGTVSTVTKLAISGVAITNTSTLTITLASPVSTGIVTPYKITLNYTAGASPVRDQDGNLLTNLTGFAVANYSVDGDHTAPSLKWSGISQDRLQLIYNKPLDPAFVPVKEFFQIKVNTGAASNPQAVGLADNQVILTLAASVRPSDSVTGSYTLPATNWLRDKGGNKVPAFSNQPVVNNTPRDTTPPVLTQAEVNGKTMLLTYSEPLDTVSLPSINDFVMTDTGATAVHPANVAIRDCVVTLSFATPVRTGATVTLSYTPGAAPLRDLAGNAAAALQSYPVINKTVGFIAPPIDPTVPGSLYDNTSFLYTGTNPVQTGVLPDIIEMKRAAVVRGKVTDINGDPLPGVAVTIAGHPEFGETQTRSDGYFDMAVNGGGWLTVSYAKTGYLPLQRQVDVPWQDFCQASEAIMLVYDSAANFVDLSQNTLQVAAGSRVTDKDGTRQTVLLIPPNTTAQMTLNDGSSQPLEQMTIRATEYTVGDQGPSAMPGELPANVAYTYAVEYSADEAVAAGAKKISFSQPLIHYVENFLGFPVGSAVPVGYYDREKTTWIAENNGLVVKLVGVTNGLADLDLTGEGTAADAAALAGLGVSDSERQQLAIRYQTGESLWRVPMNHFTPWDCNWPYGPPEDAEAPEQPENYDKNTDNPCRGSGSIIEYQNQILGESIGIHGTPFSLYYSSRNSEGYLAGRSVTIPLSGPVIPASLQGIRLEVAVAGQNFVKDFPARASQSYIFIWDGKDAYGRLLSGVQTAQIKIGYIYEGVYQSSVTSSRSFGQSSGIAITGGAGSTTSIAVRQPVIIWQTRTAAVEYEAAPNPGIGSWSINAHHVYNLAEKTIYFGDGIRRSTEMVNNLFSSVAGIYLKRGNSGEGGPAGQAKLYCPSGIAVAPDGGVYISDTGNNRICRIGIDGIITVIAGTGGEGYSGDGGLATAAQLAYPKGIHVSMDGSLYIADHGNNRIRKVDETGIITTVAGTDGFMCNGDEQLAVTAKLFSPVDVTMDAGGNLYIAEIGLESNRIRRVDPAGIITTVAGIGGMGGYSGDGGPAISARLNSPHSVAVGIDGSLYIADANNNRIRRVGTDGIITTVAGTGEWGYSGDYGRAVDAELRYPSYVAVANDGTLYISDWDVVRRVGKDGIITTMNGSGEFLNSGGMKKLKAPWGIALGKDGGIYVSDNGSHSVFEITLTLSAINGDEIVIPSEDGSEVYIFDTQGRHLRTLNALNEAVIYSFEYDPNGYLVVIQDGDGNRTILERDAAGVVTGIIAPGGQRTGLQIGLDGYLEGIVCPMGKVTQLVYDSQGLLTQLTDHKGNTHHFTYDEKGLLVKDQNPSGGSTTLTRSEKSSGYTVTAVSSLGRRSVYSVEHQSGGGDKRSNTDSAGAQIEAEINKSGYTRVNYPDGMIKKSQAWSDPRWNMQVPLTDSTVITPGGLQSSVLKRGTISYDPEDSRLKTLTYTATVIPYEYDISIPEDSDDPDNPYDNPYDSPYDTMQMSTTVTATDTQTDTQTWTTIYDAADSQVTATTPLGHKTVTTLDNKGHIVQQQIDELEAIRYMYDSKGGVTTVRQQDQLTTYGYDDKHRISSVTDTAGHQVQYEYNDANLLTRMTLANGSSYQYGYDANGNCNQITMPNGAVHQLAYNAMNQDSAYTPPGGSSCLLEYDQDGNPVRLTLPGGRKVETTYDQGGRLSGNEHDAATVTVTYADVTERVSHMTRTPKGGGTAQSTSFTYDGSLITSVTATGTAESRYAYRYDNRFDVVGITLDDGQETVLTRDADGQLTGYGPFSIERSGPAGAPAKLGDGLLEITCGYDSMGRLTDRLHTVSGEQEYCLQVSYNNIGKIKQKAETVAGLSAIYEYMYDSIGQLTEVKKNGAVSESYGYDGNGNRTGKQLGSYPPENATYDLQDRLISLGGSSYTFDTDGFLTRRGDDTFLYSAAGELLKAALANGNVVVYAYDGTGRRVARTVNGQTCQYLYGNLGNPYQITATKDAAGLSTYYYDSMGFLFALERQGSRYYVATDQVGSPRLVADSSGAVIKTLGYDSFGNLTSDSNPDFFLPVGFAGGMADADTGLLQFGFRDYDPGTGRWTAKDPLLFAGKQGNLYAYCFSDPVNYKDPSGLGYDYWDAAADAFNTIAGYTRESSIMELFMRIT